MIALFPLGIDASFIYTFQMFLLSVVVLSLAVYKFIRPLVDE
jgi:hypothetical protein